MRAVSGLAGMGCDLMLNWNVMQLASCLIRPTCCCDLMLNWNVMQWPHRPHCERFVVI